MLGMLAFAAPAFAANDVPVPTACTADVNAALANVVASKTKRDIDNIMVCGTAVGKTMFQGAGSHGSHHVTTLSVPFPNGQTVMVQVVTNDDLDGVVTANNGDQVYAYGQAYVDHGRWVAGVHDVHCSTHPTADNGWIVVNGVKTPSSCPSH